MKVTIDIPDMYIPILSKWASVSRTLKNANHICNEFLLLTKDKHLKDKAFIARDELDLITQALDNLHQTVRNEIWNQQRKDNASV